MRYFIFFMTLIATTPVFAHDPIFSIGPHTIYKGGVEVSTTFEQSKSGDTMNKGLMTTLAYGVTGDWVAGIELPYNYKKENSISNSGLGDVELFTKYRFWRNDQFQAQDSMAVIAKVKLNSSNDNGTPSISAGASDAILGITYGHEALKYYRWASLRYRYNGENNAGLNRGDKVLFDIVGGYRPTSPSYYKPDTVWILELNGEYTEKSELNGLSISNTGGTEIFISPGIFWTYRNFAVKNGVQLPVYNNLNKNQSNSDYRAKLTLEWHF